MDNATRCSVLVVDDEAPMRDFLQKALSDLGYEAVAVGDGRAALQALEDRAFDAMLLDLRLPGVSGREVLRRARERRPSLATIVTTGYPSEKALVECMNDGAARFMVKPFAVDELARAISSSIHERRKPSLPGSQDLVVQSGLRDWVEITAPSRQEHLERLENFVDVLYGTRLDESAKEDIKIAISEIASNAMEWGNRQDERRRVKVSYCLFPAEIVFKIEDEGEGFSPAGVPDPSGNPIAHVMERTKQGKRVGGYGLHIVRKVMDQVVYSDKGNVVIMSKSLTGPRGGASRAKGDPTKERTP
jgi:CheY-like chemotaxis protein/anti-sigma regulatory factor (Ser/Thr protein kinase)